MNQWLYNCTIIQDPQATVADVPRLQPAKLMLPADPGGAPDGPAGAIDGPAGASDGLAGTDDPGGDLPKKISCVCFNDDPGRLN